MIISRTAVDDYLSRDFDNFRWIKKVARAQLERELLDMRVRPIFRTRPWTHQLACFLIGMTYPDFLFLLDMGLGKSKIISDLLTQRIREKAVPRGLVLVPRLINMASWEDDLDRHADLSSTIIDVSESDSKRDLLLNPKTEVTIIDYQGLHWALCKKEGKPGKRRLVKDDKLIRKVQKLYPFLTMDESHKLGNHQSLWFSIVRELSKAADFRYSTTGTLFGRDPEAVWSQYFLVDQGDTFGENLGLFRSAFFEQKQHAWKGTTFIPLRSMTRPFNTMLGHRSISYDDTEVPETELPPCRDLVDVVHLGDEQRQAYIKVIDGIIDAGGEVTKLESGAWVKLRQIASGYLTWDDRGVKRHIAFKYNPKMEALERRIELVGDRKFIISVEYTETGRMISERLTQLGIKHVWFYGGTKDPIGARDQFMHDPACQCFLMNSAAGGTGTDGLQKVAHTLFFYEEPSGPTGYKQTRKRVYRSGQRHRSTVVSIRAKRSVDVTIAESRAEGIDLYDQIVGGNHRISQRLLFGG